MFMQKIICKKVYDTETATVVKKVCFGAFGSLNGYEETLYQTESGSYFLYVNGGAQSKYTKENITRMSAEKASDWLKTHE